MVQSNGSVRGRAAGDELREAVGYHKVSEKMWLLLWAEKWHNLPRFSDDRSHSCSKNQWRGNKSNLERVDVKTGKRLLSIWETSDGSLDQRKSRRDGKRYLDCEVTTVRSPNKLDTECERKTVRKKLGLACWVGRALIVGLTRVACILVLGSRSGAQL